MNRDDEWAEGDYLDWLDYLDEEEYNQSHLPPSTTQGSKLPNPKKKQPFNIKWDFGKKKSKDSVKERLKLKKLKEEKMEKKVEAAKKIKWVIIERNMEYKVEVGGESLGRVINQNGKWIIKPGFNWNKNSYRNQVLTDSAYNDFRDSGHALVDLWCLA